MGYKYVSESRNRLTLSEVAREAGSGTTIQRVSRIVKKLQIPVLRMGHMVMIDRRGVARVLEILSVKKKAGPKRTGQRN